jgi:predicted Zn-dependent protease
MALLDSIDIEEEIIDNAIYLKLSIAKHSAPLYLHFTNITKYPQSTPSYHFVQQDGMDMDKLQVYSQKFARTLPQRQLIVQDGQKISQVSTSEIVNHWLKTPFE